MLLYYPDYDTDIISCNQFFYVFHPLMPIINRTRFESEILQASPPIEVQALHYAIGALGALTMPELQCYIGRCYDEARNLLDMCERQESSGSLTNINALQACALLTLYEFKRPNFARAWMTLGRAIRLVRIMGLHRGDGHNCVTAFWGQPMPLASPSSKADLEEWRRTFWLLYIFDSFANVKANLGSGFDRQVG